MAIIRDFKDFITVMGRQLKGKKGKTVVKGCKLAYLFCPLMLQKLPC